MLTTRAKIFNIGKLDGTLEQIYIVTNGMET